MDKLCRRLSYYTFYVGVFIETLIVILDKSDYVIQYDGWIFRITFLLFLFKFVCTKYSKKEYVYIWVFLIIGGISYFCTGRNEIIRMIIMIAACKDIDIIKTLKGIFWMTLLGVMCLILLSILGVFGNLALVEDFGRGVVQTRYCLGLGHPNAFHCMVFVLTLLGIYLYHDKVGVLGYIIAAIVNGIVFVLTDSRTSIIAVVVFLLLALILQYCKKLQTAKWVYIAGIGFLLFAVLLSVLFAVYCTDIPLFAKMDKLLTGRIFALRDSVRHEGMIETWSAFSDRLNDNYFDLGFVRMFFWYGWVPTVLYIIMHIKLLWVSCKKKDYMLLAFMMVYTLYTIFEAHFVSVYMGRNYLIFFMGMYLVELTGTKECDEEEYILTSWKLVRKGDGKGS